MQLKFILKIESPTQDVFDLRDRHSNELQVSRQRPGITRNALRKNEQRAQICIDEDKY